MGHEGVASAQLQRDEEKETSRLDNDHGGASAGCEDIHAPSAARAFKSAASKPIKKNGTDNISGGLTNDPVDDHESCDDAIAMEYDTDESSYYTPPKKQSLSSGALQASLCVADTVPIMSSLCSATVARPGGPGAHVQANITSSKTEAELHQSMIKKQHGVYTCILLFC